MKVTVQQVPDKSMEEATLRVAEMSDDVRMAISLLENGEGMLIGTKDGEQMPCPFSKIYYAESVDEKTFIYTKSECLEVKYKLYELESLLDQRFFRCSKSMICNIRKIKSVKTGDNARLHAMLLNGESIVISRSYVPEFKKRLGLKA